MGPLPRRSSALYECHSLVCLFGIHIFAYNLLPFFLDAPDWFHWMISSDSDSLTTGDVDQFHVLCELGLSSKQQITLSRWLPFEGYFITWSSYFYAIHDYFITFWSNFHLCFEWGSDMLFAVQLYVYMWYIFAKKKREYNHLLHLIFFY